MIAKLFTFLNYIYKTFFFDPLAGGNGKIQMNELGQAILLVMIVKASIREGSNPGQDYPDVYWICLFGCIAAIAAIKPAFSKAITNHLPSSSTPV